MERQHVLIISVLRNPSGNFTTASRIRGHFEKCFFECTLRDPKSFGSIKDFTDFVNKTDVTLVLGIHAIHTGKYLNACPVPFVLIFGGTDLNVYGCRPDSKKAMKHVVNKAKYLVGFSEEMMNAAIGLWPELGADPDRIRIIQQGVITFPSRYDVKEAVIRHMKGSSDSRSLDDSDSINVFSLVAGIRPVKDPLFLVETFSEWHRCCQPNAFLVIVGPIIDDDYGLVFLDRIKDLVGVLYLGSLEPADSHGAVKSSLALVNSSLSEGNSMAILEAMDMSVPVIARNINGNKALIKDERNGLLFSTPQDVRTRRTCLSQALTAMLSEKGMFSTSERNPTVPMIMPVTSQSGALVDQEFIKKAEMLIDDRGLRHRLVENGLEIVNSIHGCDTERASYHDLAK